MPEFSAPPRKQGKIAPAVPINQVPAEKREEYEGLIKAMQEEVKGENLQQKLDDGPLPGVEQDQVQLDTSVIEIAGTRLTITEDGRIVAVDRIEPIVKDFAEPTDEDKQAFVRTIFGNKTFTKEFTLFGEMKVILADRTAAQTEDMYKQLEKLDPAPASPEEWGVELERYLAAMTVKSIDGKELDGTDLKTKAKSLMELSRPLYVAVLDASRTFERMVEFLASRAQDKDFWKAGGAA